MKPHIQSARAFTLIEMLIVAGIIIILMGTAIPNLRQAQTRAKVSRIKADHTAIMTALEAYAMDYNCYPSARFTFIYANHPAEYYHITGSIGFCRGLSTPVAYLTNTRLEDPYTADKPMRDITDSYAEKYGMPLTYLYATTGRAISDGHATYAVWSQGPSGVQLMIPAFFPTLMKANPRSYLDRYQYDASNGTYAKGFVMRYQQ